MIYFSRRTRIAARRAKPEVTEPLCSIRGMLGAGTADRRTKPGAVGASSKGLRMLDFVRAATKPFVTIVALSLTLQANAVASCEPGTAPTYDDITAVLIT